MASRDASPYRLVSMWKTSFRCPPLTCRAVGRKLPLTGLRASSSEGLAIHPAGGEPARYPSDSPRRKGEQPDNFKWTQYRSERPAEKASWIWYKLSGVIGGIVCQSNGGAFYLQPS
jgi:hypothetical protein